MSIVDVKARIREPRLRSIVKGGGFAGIRWSDNGDVGLHIHENIPGCPDFWSGMNGSFLKSNVCSLLQLELCAKWS